MDATVSLWLLSLLVLCSGSTQKLSIGDVTLGFITELVFDVIAKRDMQCFTEHFEQHATISIELRVGYKVKIQ